MKKTDVIVVGGGIGGLCAATLLGARGLDVVLLEAAAELGGKAGTTVISGVEVDTGPSVLTLPEVFDEVFLAVGLNPREELPLVTPSLGFRYLYEDGTELDVFHSPAETLDSVARSLGTQARDELQGYLEYSRKIWEAAAPHFVMSQAPSVARLLLGGLGALGAVSKIDPFSTLSAAIRRRVSSPHLRRLLMRYATYNGSDARSAPATLGCIAHVELSLGGYGVRGGMAELPRALVRAAKRAGVHLITHARVDEIATFHNRVTGVRLEDGSVFEAPQVVMNGDVASLTSGLLQNVLDLHTSVPSMSAYCGVFRARSASTNASGRAAHTVLFPDNYEREFADIFDYRRVPEDPTIYLCSQKLCHQRATWEESEPVFCMINAPAVSEAFDGKNKPGLQEGVKARLVSRGLLNAEDELLWWRTPLELAQRFPGSGGALYGAASNNAAAAFKRPPNRLTKVKGLYLASGSAHPGGGLPMVAQSGKLAAEAAAADRGIKVA